MRSNYSAAWPPVLFGALLPSCTTLRPPDPGTFVPGDYQPVIDYMHRYIPEP